MRVLFIILLVLTSWAASAGCGPNGCDPGSTLQFYDHICRDCTTSVKEGGGEKWDVLAVYDGDTVALGRADFPAVRLRLAGIDAPEHDQPYGPEAKAALEGLLKGCGIHFIPVAVDRYGRTVARLTACGRDVNAELVRLGAAWVYTRFNNDPALRPMQDKAEAARAGLWHDSGALAPWEWRKTHQPEWKIVSGKGGGGAP